MKAAWAVLIAGIALAGAAAGGAWVMHQRDARVLAQVKTDHAEEVARVDGLRLEAEQLARAKETTIGELRDAERKQRGEAQAAVDAARTGAGAQLVSLRKQLADAQRRADLAAANPATGPSLDAGTANATVLRYVVGQCAERYVTVANVADQLRIQVIGLQSHARAVATQ